MGVLPEGLADEPLEAVPLGGDAELTRGGDAETGFFGPQDVETEKLTYEAFSLVRDFLKLAPLEEALRF